LQLFDLGLCRELPLKTIDDTSDRHAQEVRAKSILNDMDNEDEQSTTLQHQPKDEYYLMTIVGTRRYMAIEMFISGRYNCKADVYGWAMTCYELLSLSKPFAPLSDSDHQEYVCIQGKRPNVKPLLQQCEAPPGKQPPILKVIRAAWEQYVGKRIDISTVVERLERILKDRNGGDKGVKSAKTQPHTVTEISATEGGSYSSPSDSDDEQLQEHEPDDCEEDDDRSIESLLADKVVSMSVCGNSRHSMISADDPSTRDGSTDSLRWDDSSATTMGAPGSSGGSLSTLNFEELLKDRHGASLRKSSNSLNNNSSGIYEHSMTGSASGSLLGPPLLSTPPNMTSSEKQPGLSTHPTALRIASVDGSCEEGEEDEDLLKQISGR
jgi:hypothetical protein